MKIACIGTQNIGKTTYIEDFLKKWTMYEKPEKSYRDIIKEKKLNINEEGNEKNQKIILDSLIDQILENSDKNFIIFDRSVLDNLAYTSWLYLNDNVSEKFLNETRDIVRESLKLYDILFFFPLTKFSDIPIEKDGLRSTSESFRTEIDTIFKSFQDSYLKGDGRVFPPNDCPAMIEIFGNREERVKLTGLYIKENGKPFGDDESLIKEVDFSSTNPIIVT
jgi:hypothetical protein